MTKGAQLSLVISLTVVGAVVVFGVAFWIGRITAPTPPPVAPTANNNTTTANQPITPPSTPANTAPTIQSDFKTYQDTKTGVGLAYPRTWGSPDVQDCLAADEVPGCIVDSRDLGFQLGENEFRTIRVTNANEYQELTSAFGATVEVANASDELVNKVYDSKVVENIEFPVLLPPTNAAVIAAVPPTYVENFDASWRGYYYFATMGQNDPETGSPLRTANSIILTLSDGNETVVQLEVYSNFDLLDPPTQFADELTRERCVSTLIDDSGNPLDVGCQVPQVLADLLESEVLPFADALQSI